MSDAVLHVTPDSASGDRISGSKNARSPKLTPCFTTRRGRLFLFCLVLLAGISIVGTALIRIQTLPPDSYSEVTWSQLTAALVLSATTLLHMVYLLVVIQVTVLQEISFPRTVTEILRRYLTMFLCLAYAAPLTLYLLGLATTGNSATASLAYYGPFSWPSKLISLCLFLIVYVIWLTCEILEFRQADQNAHSSRQWILLQKSIWTTIEIVSVGVIVYSLLKLTYLVDNQVCWSGLSRADCLYFYERWDPFNKRASLIEPKDVFVFFCLAFFAILRVISRDSSPRTELYPVWYGKYITATQMVRADVAKPAQVLPHIHFVLKGGSILDFGCGDGQRLRQILTLILGNEEIQASRITGIDRNGDWEEPFSAVFKDGHFQRKIADPAQKFDFIHLSHVLYERNSTADAIELIKRHSRPDTIVCVRGASANSPTYLLSVALASNMFNYHPHHHWKPLHLDHLIKECGLVPLVAQSRSHSGDTRTPNEPDIVFRQAIGITNEGILSSVLGAIFPGSRQFSYEVLCALRAARVKRVAMDDEVYLFRYQGHKA